MDAMAKGNAKSVCENLTNEPQLYSQPKGPTGFFSLAFFFGTTRRCAMHGQKTSLVSVSFLGPAWTDVMGDAHLIQHPCNNSVSEILQCFGATVKKRIGG